MAGLPMPVVTREAVEREEKRKSLHDVMELAAKFFEGQLAGRAGAQRAAISPTAISTPATQQKFRLGYAPNERFALKEALGAQGVPVADMVETGLLIAGDDIPVPYDRFRDRVMFPISDMRGRVIAFGGRALQKDVPAKYLNSPETTLFHKGSTALQHRGGPPGRAPGRADRRCRGLRRRHRAGRRRLSGRGRAARHGADRGPARAASGKWRTSR